jgi:hypothetical protein
MLDALPSGRGIHAIATPINETEKLVAQQSTVVVSLWREGPAVIRGTITHGSGVVAYFQGGEPLAEIARILQLSLRRCD